MGIKTSLYDQHVLLKAHMVEFAGYELPINYGSQINEHQAVRNHAGLFDVSHMNIVDVTGKDSKKFLRYILANDVDKLVSHKALYSCLLNPDGGVIDDLIVYMFSENFYRLILNAATKSKDMAWLHHCSEEYEVNILSREDLSIIALQGPQASQILTSAVNISPDNIKPFSFIEYQEGIIARTGYTGEDGFEVIIKNQFAVELWQKLLKSGAIPAGLGARDTLRLEAGYNLYGQDMDENTSPLESNLAWTIAFEPKERDFVGRKKLTEKKISQSLMGVVLKKGGILRHGQKILTDNNQVVGTITSGGFSPVLNCSIGLARMIAISLEESASKNYFADIRGKLVPVFLTKPVFVRKGAPVVEGL